MSFGRRVCVSTFLDFFRSNFDLPSAPCCWIPSEKIKKYTLSAFSKTWSRTANFLKKTMMMTIRSIVIGLLLFLSQEVFGSQVYNDELQMRRRVLLEKEMVHEDSFLPSLAFSFERCRFDYEIPSSTTHLYSNSNTNNL